VREFEWEIQLTPPEWQYWSCIGSPSMMAGMLPNFKGDTCAVYAGLIYEFTFRSRSLPSSAYR
jgi:hypothetical protein